MNTRVDRVKQELLQQALELEPLNGQSGQDGQVKPELELPTALETADFIEFLENNQHILTCRTCYKVFTTVEGLRCHKRLHTGGMFKCKICDKEYTRQNHLQRHEMSHGSRKVHVCKICNKTLTRFEHLKRHLTIHLKEKPFSCHICNRGFNRQEHLANHVKRCKGDRIFFCDICNKGFTREDSLEVHRKLHGNKMPVLPTLDNLDNIEEHYYQIDYDGPYSDHSDNELDDCFEPQISLDITEDSTDQKPDNPISEQDSKEESEVRPEKEEKKMDVDVKEDSCDNDNTNAG